MPHMKCAFTTGVHGISREDCQQQAVATGDSFYSWKYIDAVAGVSNQCFTTKTCTNVLSSTVNDWEVWYCQPANIADKMCVASPTGQACCAASCGQCGGLECASAPGGNAACCPDTISAAGKSCVTDFPPCVFKPDGFPTSVTDYQSTFQWVDGKAPTVSVANTDVPTTGFGYRGAPKEIETKAWIKQARKNANELSVKATGKKVKDA